MKKNKKHLRRRAGDLCSKKGWKECRCRKRREGARKGGERNWSSRVNARKKKKEKEDFRGCEGY